MKLLKNIPFALSLFTLVWAFASYVEVICIHHTPDHIYSWWNLFALLF